MANFADLKGMLVRMDSALERLDGMRPRLDAGQIENLENAAGHCQLMRDELHDLLLRAPDEVGIPIGDIPLGLEEQEAIDTTVTIVSRSVNELEEWLDEHE
jgi:hypothetical protein